MASTRGDLGRPRFRPCVGQGKTKAMEKKAYNKRRSRGRHHGGAVPGPFIRKRCRGVEKIKAGYEGAIGYGRSMNGRGVGEPYTRKATEKKGYSRTHF